MKNVQTYRSSLPVLILLCSILVGVADFLFYEHQVGWNLGLYPIPLLAAMLFRSRTLWREKIAWRILLALLGLIAALICQPGPIAFFLLSTGILSLALIERHGWTSNTLIWIQRWIVFGFKALYQILHDLRLFQHLQKRRNGTSTVALLGRVFLNWSLPVFFSLIFVSLFSAANPVVERSIGRINDLLANLKIDVGRLVFWCFTGAALWALFRVRVNNPLTKASIATPLPAPASPAFITRCLTLFNLVFAVETGLDLLYLWGGASLPEGLTYAAYAHRGAYPLIVTALLAGGFVLITFRQNASTIEMRIPRILVYIWLGQNVFLTFSSIYRLDLYVQMYSLSRWRVGAALWMLLVAAGLALIAFRILQSKTNLWLLNANFLAAIALLYVCCFLNFDSMIAWYNVRHCREITGEGVGIDLTYLSQLGPESLAAIEWLKRQPSVPAKIVEGASRVGQQLERRLLSELQDWRGWTYRRHVLMKQYLPNLRMAQVNEQTR